jgi:SSS family solute:Na+ symporter
VATNISVTTHASIIVDGFQKQGLTEKQDGWYLVPGKVDKVSYLLLVFFVLVIGFLLLFEYMI